MSIPTRSEEYSKLMEHLAKGQEAAAMLAHLENAQGGASGTVLGRGWMHVSEALKKMQGHVITIATKGLQ